jgi:hypothetical protein
MTKGELRAEEYRARAQEALASVEAASLDRVREQRRQSAAIWTEMADAEEARARIRPIGTPAAHDETELDDVALDEPERDEPKIDEPEPNSAQATEEN